MDWPTVLERNSVERIKRDKPPLGIRDELPALVALGYERMAEEDVVRLQWWALYHDKPKIGTFMLRVKIPSGILAPSRLRRIGEVANRYGRGDAELTTRQCIQLHWLELGRLADVFADLEDAGITSAGGCGDTVRNITGCPLTGLAHDELFDATPVLEEAARFFYGNVEYANMPRKHKISIGACAHRCWGPEINDISLIGAIRDGEPGLGLVSGTQLVQLADLAEELGGDARITRQQNLILTSVPEARVAEVESRLTELGLPLDVNGLRGASIACTGEPHCNFSVTETKSRLGGLIERLEARFGADIAPLRLQLDGCPHACGQHWVADLGFQGTTARDEQGTRRQAYDIFLRGGLGPGAAIGRPLFRRILTEELDRAVEGLVQGWLDH